MKDGKEAHREHRQHQRQASIDGDRDAQHQHREGDAQLDCRERHLKHAERTAQGHHDDKGGRHRPDGPATDLGAENSHADHRQEVIRPQHRMRETTDEGTQRQAPGFVCQRVTRQGTKNHRQQIANQGRHVLEADLRNGC
jgi:hypothetical protein